MFVNSRNAQTHSGIAAELARGGEMTQDLYRRAWRLTRWFENFVFAGRFNAAGRTPHDVVMAMGSSGATWFRSMELACNLIAEANRISGAAGVAPSVVPEGWSYRINQNRTVTLTQEATEPIELAAAG